jgi:hypothetical protein
MLVNFYWTIRCPIPENGNLYCHCHWDAHVLQLSRFNLFNLCMKVLNYATDLIVSFYIFQSISLFLGNSVTRCVLC